MKYFFCSFSFLLFLNSSSKLYSQSDSVNIGYEKTFSDIKEALDNNIAFNFKQICFLTENTISNSQLDYIKFNNKIKELKALINSWMLVNPIRNYHYHDSLDFQKNLAIYKALKDTIKIIMNDSVNFIHLPYTYDFNDFFGEQDWSNMFVTKLLATHSATAIHFPISIRF